ncbi:MAG: ECF transporter S component [Clostridia bacterium]|nr:ECF transporter S component [Clostridia bacterium]
MTRNKALDIRKLVYLSVLTAIVVVLQLIGNYVAIPIAGAVVSISLSLIPIVIASTMRGPWAGGWLGFVSAMVILLFNGATFFLGLNPLGTIVTVIIKGTASGIAAGFVYRVLSKINKYLGIFVAAAVCPIVNTGIFFIGGLIFFADIIWVVAIGALINFSFEIAVNLIFSPTILRLVELVEKKH